MARVIRVTGDAPETTDAGELGVLLVGRSNLCRSVAAEHLLRAALASPATASPAATSAAPTSPASTTSTAGPTPPPNPDAPLPNPAAPPSRIVVSSAGLEPEEGGRVPAALRELLAESGESVEDHTPRAVSRELVEAADLVLTATRAERATVVMAVPTAVRRAFTLLELARIVDALDLTALPDGTPDERLAALVELAATHRARADEPDDDDLADPRGGVSKDYAACIGQIAAAVDTIVSAVRAADPQAAEPDFAVTYPPVRRRLTRGRAVALGAVGAFVAVVAGLAVSGVAVVARLDERVERFPDPFAGLPSRPAPAPAPDPAAPEARPLTVLVLGSADDSSLASALGDAARRGDDDGLSDVVMLARVSADRSSAQLVAIPPELLTQVPGAGEAPVGSALAVGGPPAAVQAVEQLTDVRVDHVAVTDPATFVAVSDSLGGVDLDVPEPVVVAGRTVVPAGPQRLTGAQALAWVVGTDDDHLAQSARQQTWLRAILDRVGDPEVASSPTSWLQLLGVVSGSLSVDEGLDRDTMVGLLSGVRGLRADDVDVVTAPTTTQTTDDGATVLVPDPQPFEELMAALRTDDLGEVLDREGDGQDPPDGEPETSDPAVPAGEPTTTPAVDPTG